MSHFSVLVIGNDVDSQLQPFHEFECTGKNDQYIQNIDITADTREEYEKDTTRKLKSPDGQLFDPYDDRFYREPTQEESKTIGTMLGSGIARGVVYTSKDWGDGLGYRAKVQFIPEGYEEVVLPTQDTTTFANFVEDWHGKERINENATPDLDGDHKYGWYRVRSDGEVIEVIDRTNPNKKWDWWVIGGRWTGFFKLKDGATGQLGEPGLMTDPARSGYADIARKSDIDFGAMRDEAANKAAKQWDDAHEAAGDSWESFKSIRERISDIDLARAEYRGQPAIQKMHERRIYWDVDQFLAPREDFIQAARIAAAVPYAIVKDGEWFARGEMGWWGVSLDESDKSEWAERVTTLLDGLPDDTILTAVDCHI